MVTATPDSQSVFTARYDEDMWLQDQSRDWTNFEIDESGREDDWHGTEITVSKVKVPECGRSPLHHQTTGHQDASDPLRKQIHKSNQS